MAFMLHLGSNCPVLSTLLSCITIDSKLDFNIYFSSRQTQGPSIYSFTLYTLPVVLFLPLRDVQLVTRDILGGFESWVRRGAVQGVSLCPVKDSLPPHWVLFGSSLKKDNKNT